MSNLNGLRQAISLAMIEGDKSVTISTEMASMIVVEYEKHRVTAKDAIDDKARQFSELEGIKKVANDLAAENADLKEDLSKCRVAFYKQRDEFFGVKATRKPGVSDGD